jgi:hypothetical protein
MNPPEAMLKMQQDPAAYKLSLGFVGLIIDENQSKL